MKINHLTNAVLPEQSLDKSKGADRPAARGVSPTQAPGEKLSLSDLATSMSDLEASLSKIGEFDAARVENIKTAIRDGHFKVNADAVADRLIESVKQLLDTK